MADVNYRPSLLDLLSGQTQNVVQEGRPIGYANQPATPTTIARPLNQQQMQIDTGQAQANQMIASQRGALASQIAASRGALTQSAQAQQRQLATAMQQAQREYNLQRQQQQEQAFMQSRQLQQAAQARGLGQSGLAQLAQLQQGMQQGQLTNQAAQGMQQARLGYAEQARGTQQNLANQLMQLEASQQAGEANIAQQQFQTNLSLQDKSRSILTELYSVARAGQDMTAEDWNFIASQYGLSPELLGQLQQIWSKISGKKIQTGGSTTKNVNVNEGIERAISPVLNP